MLMADMEQDVCGRTAHVCNSSKGGILFFRAVILESRLDWEKNLSFFALSDILLARMPSGLEVAAHQALFKQNNERLEQILARAV